MPPLSKTKVSELTLRKQRFGFLVLPCSLGFASDGARLLSVVTAKWLEIDAFLLGNERPFQHKRVDGAHVFADDAKGDELNRAQEEEA